MKKVSIITLIVLIFFSLLAYLFSVNNEANATTDPPPSFVIPTADITIDGDITDWQDIPVVAISPQAPAGTYPLGADVKSLKLAKKDNMLYYLFEVWDSSIDTTGEVGYRLWFDNNKNGIINGDPEDRQVSSHCQNGVCQVWSQAMDGFIDADGFAQSSGSFIETSVRADILGIWPSFRLESGTHSEIVPVSFDRFPPVEEVIYLVERILPDKAAELAKDENVIGADYLWGGKGYSWKWGDKRFIEPTEIKEGYYYLHRYYNEAEEEWKDEIIWAKGLDCAGISFWSYNKAYGAKKYKKTSPPYNPIHYEGADGQYRKNVDQMDKTTPKEDLIPGDLLFFDWEGDNYKDHVEMYVGDFYYPGGIIKDKEYSPGIYDVVRAWGDETHNYGIIPDRLSNRIALNGFVGFGRVTEPIVGGTVSTTGSPVDIILTDPDGFTITKDIWEIPGVLYYSIYDIDENGELEDMVTIPERKIGDYLITVVPEPDALPTDTYSLEITAVGETIVLAEDVPISEIPDEGYGIRSTETEIKIITPKLLKTDAILKLESAKTGHKIIDKEIDLIIKHIEKSLNDKFWRDASHLEAKYGKKVFHEEHKAVVHMHYKTKSFEKIIPVLERIIEKKQKRGLDTTKEELKLNAVKKALPIFKEVISDLVKADEILVKIAIYEAKNTPVENPKFQKKVDHYIKKAEKELSRAYQELEKNRPTRTIKRFEKAWKYTQLAIKFAKLKKR